MVSAEEARVEIMLVVNALILARASLSNLAPPEAPGAPTAFIMVNNEDGTADISWLLADDTNTTSKIEIWKNDTTEWVVLQDLSSTPTVEFANNIPVPAATGAVVNGSGEFGLRLLVGNETGDINSNDYWTQVTDIGGSSLTAGTLTLSVVDSTTINIKYATEPTNQSADPNGVQLQRVLTANEGDEGSWADVAGIDTVTELTGAGTNNTVTTETQYSYRVETTDGTDIIYPPIVRATATAATETTANLLYDGFETGDMSAPSSPSPALNAGGFSWGSNNGTSVVTQDAGDGPVAIYNNGSIYNIHSAARGDGSTRDWTAKEGSNSLRFRYDVGVDTSEQRFLLGAPKTELWLKYWIQVPVNYSHGIISSSGVNNKFLSVWMDGYEATGAGSTFWLSMESVGSGNTDLTFTYTIGGNTGSVAMQQATRFITVPDDRGKWMQMVVHLKAESTPGADDGIVQTYRRWDGESSFTLLHEKLDMPFRVATSPAGFNEGYLMGWCNGQYAVETEFLIDNFELSTESLI